jgi:hypothetical protein
MKQECCEKCGVSEGKGMSYSDTCEHCYSKEVFLDYYVWYCHKCDNMETIPETVKPYEDHSHYHCWDQETPACGIKKEDHKRCCLCEKRQSIASPEYIAKALAPKSMQKESKSGQDKVEEWELKLVNMLRDVLDTETCEPPKFISLVKSLLASKVRELDSKYNKRIEEVLKEQRKEIVNKIEHLDISDEAMMKVLDGIK